MTLDDGAENATASQGRKLLRYRLQNRLDGRAEVGKEPRQNEREVTFAKSRRERHIVRGDMVEASPPNPNSENPRLPCV